MTRTINNHSLDQLFEGRHISLKEKPKKKNNDDLDQTNENYHISSDEEMLDEEGLKDIVRPVVICKDPKEFVYLLMMERNLDPNHTQVKIGADDGQKIMKINV